MRFLRLRSVQLFSAAVLTAAGALGLLVARQLIDVWSALQLVTLIALCGLVVLLAVLVRRTNVQMRQLRRGFDRQAREIAEIAGENRAELFGRADDLVNRLDSVAASVAVLRTESEGRVSEVSGVGSGDRTELTREVAGSASVPTRAAS